jgi:hypothetical protein
MRNGPAAEAGSAGVGGSGADNVAGGVRCAGNAINADASGTAASEPAAANSSGAEVASDSAPSTSTTRLKPGRSAGSCDQHAAMRERTQGWHGGMPGRRPAFTAVTTCHGKPGNGVSAARSASDVSGGAAGAGEAPAAPRRGSGGTPAAARRTWSCCTSVHSTRPNAYTSTFSSYPMLSVSSSGAEKSGQAMIPVMCWAASRAISFASPKSATFTLMLLARPAAAGTYECTSTLRGFRSRWITGGAQ